MTCKALLFVLLCCPAILPAQEPGPDFKQDTLYATCGYKIYKGKTLQFGKGTGKNGKFKYILINNSIAPGSLAGNSIVVTGLRNYRVSPQEIAYIDITGSIVFKDGSAGIVDIRMAVNQAIENIPDKPTELIVPAEFRNSSRVNLLNNLNNLLEQYRKGEITQAEYEARKKKLLEQ